MPKSISFQDWLESPFDKPAARVVFVSVAVNSIAPSAPSIAFAETAPDVQPAVPVFERLEPAIDTPTSLDQVRPPIRTSVTVLPVS